MNTMNYIVWMLPVIFMIHDFEEIIMAEVWGKRLKKQIDAAWPKRQPFGLDYLKYFQTPTFSIGVLVEFLLFTAISFLSVIFQSYFVWAAAFLGFVLHLVFVHMLMSAKFRHYVPGVITSAVFLLPSFWYLYASEKILGYGLPAILLAGLLGIGLLALMIPMLHKAMGAWSKWMQRYSQEQL